MAKARKAAAAKLTARGRRINEQRELIDAQLKTLREIRAVKWHLGKVQQLVGDLHTEHNQNTNAIGELTGAVADLKRRLEALEKRAS